MKKAAATAEKFLTTDLGVEAEARYLNYALSVITSRALPDIRDGLKPVQRRLLYAMHENLGLGGNSRPRKSAAVVGEVLGKYHPHGDQAAYEAMVRLAQPFSLRYPLVHGEGNFGSLDGDGAAAMRYTEAKLAALSEELFRDLRGDTIPYRPNYDATLNEPIVLPARMPQLLLNGATGIAVGMATSIPPHNFTEVANALLAMIKDPTINTVGLLKHINGPDFPTGAQILTTKSELREIYETGHGTIKIRGQWKLEQLPRGKCQIVIVSIPYAVNKSLLIEKIADLVHARKVPQIIDVRDESTDDIRIVLELKPNTSEELAIAYLCRHTTLQTTFSVNLTCLVPTTNPDVGQPLKATLEDLCRHFLDFRFSVVTKRFEHELAEVSQRLHILTALGLIIDQLDKVLQLIRKAKSRKEAREKLIRQFDLDEIQSDAILDMRLFQLARLEVEKVVKETTDKEKRARALRAILRSKPKRWSLIRDEIADLAKEYGDRRRTALRSGDELVYNPDAYIINEETTVILSRDGWIKRVKELRDPASTRLREGDEIKAIYTGTTRDRILIFTNKGFLYVNRINVVTATTGYGEPLQTLFNFADGERVISADILREEDENGLGPYQATGQDIQQPQLFATDRNAPDSQARDATLLIATAQGLGFRFCPNTEETTKSGRRFARLTPRDEIVAVQSASQPKSVCATVGGRLYSFDTHTIPQLTGAGRGVKLMRLDEKDLLVGALTCPAESGVIVTTGHGTDRRIAGRDIPKGKRGGKGLRVVKRSVIAELRTAESTIRSRTKGD